MAMIEVHSLKKAFGKNAVLNGLSCTIEKGQTTAIIGPSGTGKSTLLRCMIHLETADDGDIRIEDRYRCKVAIMWKTNSTINLF